MTTPLLKDPADQPTLTQQAVTGTAWSTLSTVGRQLLSIVSVATVARLLGPGAYGVMAMAGLLLLFVTNIRDLGTGTAIVQRQTVSSRLLSSLFWVNFAVGVFLAALVILLSRFIADFFHTPALQAILCWLSISFWLTSCGIVPNSLLMRSMQYKKLALTDLCSALLGFIVALSLAYTGFGVWSLVFANIANSFATSLLYWLFCGWRPSLIFDRREVRSVMGFSLNLSGFVLVNFFSRNADNIIVGRARGQAELGSYQMAYNLMLTPLSNVSQIIAQITFPAFSRIQDDNQRFRSAYVRQSMMVALLTFPVMAGMAILADPLIRAVLGAKWTGAIPIFQILAPVGLVQSVLTLVGQIYTAKARTDLMFRWGLATSAILVLSFLAGVHYYGAVGVAAAYAAVYLAFIVFPSMQIPFHLIDLKVRDFLLALLPQSLVTFAMAVVCFLWLSLLNRAHLANSWLKLLSTSALGAVIYCGLLILLRPPVIDICEEIIGGAKHAFIARIFAFMRPLAIKRVPAAWLSLCEKAMLKSSS